MHLYLVQHAEARPKAEDPQRPLSEKGLADIRKVAAFIKDKARPVRILHSGKLRARQTAEILAASLQPAGGLHTAENLHPLDDPSPWAENLNTTDENLMLVGHLPYMSRLAARLLIGNPERTVVRFQMGGVVCLGREGATDVWSLDWMVVPEILG
jgi:phosphohistidine phosphatase